jgi:hypothetical protein
VFVSLVRLAVILGSRRIMRINANEGGLFSCHRFHLFAIRGIIEKENVF